MALVLVKKACLYRRLWTFLVFMLPSVGVCFTGCNGTCVSFTSNPPTGTVNIKAGDPAQTCMLTTTRAAIRVVARTAPPCSSCSGSHQVRHIFVSLRGIEASPSAKADAESPDWDELLPQLPAASRQIDLLGSAANGLSAPQFLGESLVRANTYSQLRLRFVSNQPAPDAALPQNNACDRAGFNCVVLDDGHVLPLELDNDAELRVMSDRIAGASFLVLPGDRSDLDIAFRLAWSLHSSDDQGLRLLPTLVATAALERPPVAQLGTQ